MRSTGRLALAAARVGAAVVLSVVLLAGSGCSSLRARQPVEPRPEPAEGTEAAPEVVLPEVAAGDGLLALGKRQLAAGAVDAAEKTLVDLVEGHPERPEIAEALFLLASLRLGGQDSAAALEVLARIVAEHPETSWASAAGLLMGLLEEKADVEHELEGLQRQLNELKRLDLPPDS